MHHLHDTDLEVSVVSLVCERAVVAVRGEIDSVGARELGDLLDWILTRTHRLELDLENTTFMDQPAWLCSR